MKKRLVSAVLVLCISMQFLVAPVSAVATGHTYYSQYGNVNSSVDKSLCFLTCLAMAISDLGNPTTPSEIYYANGDPTCTTQWGTIRQAYGVVCDNVPFKKLWC